MENKANRGLYKTASSCEIQYSRRISVQKETQEDLIRDIKEDEVINILEVDPKRRSKTQIANLANYLSKVPFFEEYVKWGKYQVVEQWSK